MRKTLMTSDQLGAASEAPYTVVRGGIDDPYRCAVERTYDDSPDLWQRIIGESLWFQFGVYDGPAAGQWTPEEAGKAFFERQLDLAAVTGVFDVPVRRVLDIGCGWGAALDYLLQRLPQCDRFDAVNVSQRQLHHCAQRLAASGMANRAQLYLCNAADISMLPDSQSPYDLVIMRGSLTHFTNEVLEACISGLARRMRVHGCLIIADNLYNVDLANYQSHVPDIDDRLACGNRKTLASLGEVLSKNGFILHDTRKLPSNRDSAQWLEQVRSQIEHHFDLNTAPRPLVELHGVAENLIAALDADKLSTYSIIATLG